MSVSLRKPVRIRNAEDGDFPSIIDVHEQAFATHDEARLVELLHKRDKIVISMVADSGGQIVGHILFTRVSLDPPIRVWKGLGLAPLAVIPAMQGQGIGTALVEAGLEGCSRIGVDLVVVLGDPSYYGKFGFKPAAFYGLTDEYQAGEAFMVLGFKPDVGMEYSGLVRYPSEFDELGV